MKTHYYKWMTPIFILAAFVFSSTESYSQTRKLPDGSVVYPDGSRKLPNGTVVYKNGTIKKRNSGDRVIYPDSRREDQRRRRRRRSREVETRHNTNGKWIPPGQAKKIYGGNARDYAPGHQKKWKKGRKNGNWVEDDREDHNDQSGRHESKRRGKKDD